MRETELAEFTAEEKDSLEAIAALKAAADPRPGDDGHREHQRVDRQR